MRRGCFARHPAKERRAASAAAPAVLSFLARRGIMGLAFASGARAPLSDPLPKILIIGGVIKMALPGKQNDRDAKCPFFHSHNKSTISCESPVPGATNYLTFAKPKEKALQYSLFCCYNFKSCEMYLAAMAQYSD